MPIPNATRAPASGEAPTVAHPGVAREQRLDFLPVSLEPSERLVVAEGEDLFRTIHARLDLIGAEGAAFRLVEGVFSHLITMTGGSGEGERPISFRGPHTLATPARVVAGAAGSGRHQNGERFSHCHAAFLDRTGQSVGGHLMPDRALAGPGGVTVEIAPLSGAVFNRRFDPETHFDLFHPEPL